ncbi:MAG: hypothetical protein IMZ50_09960 [Candidatus Atribacteria bacterium]|nr:hypothetical protein [Candidatus Atribacteria bacterium]
MRRPYVSESKLLDQLCRLARKRGVAVCLEYWPHDRAWVGKVEADNTWGMWTSGKPHRTRRAAIMELLREVAAKGEKDRAD